LQIVLISILLLVAGGGPVGHRRRLFFLNFRRHYRRQRRFFIFLYMKITGPPCPASCASIPSRQHTHREETLHKPENKSYRGLSYEGDLK